MRAFLALDIPAPVIGYLTGVIERLAKRTEGVKWARSEGIHITVKFLGEIEEVLAERMREALSPLATRFEPFTTRLDGLDAFPSRRSARVVVVKLKEGNEQIQTIFSEVEDRLAELDVEREKRGLVPHITLGRRRIPKPFPNGDPMPLEEKEFAIEHLVLYRSVLMPGGAVYTPLWKVKFGGEKKR
jgi:RNA 2',3'-cyclic 3'-phosphodiesterase